MAGQGRARARAVGDSRPKDRPPSYVLLSGAGQARNDQDHVQVEKLARAALLAAETEGDRTTAGQLLGDALFELGSFAEAEVVLAAADERAGDDGTRLHIGLGARQ